MVNEKVTLSNDEGLYARTAAKFLQNAVKFKSQITLTKGNKSYDGKSILSILSMAGFKGDEIVISCEGNDEQEALECLTNFIKEI